MTVFLDIIGSWILRGSLIAVMLTVILNLNSVVYQGNQRATAKRAVAMADSVIYSDLNEAGNCVVGTTFLTASSNDMKFYGDVTGDRVPETIRYYAVAVAGTNPTLYKLYRNVSNENSGIDLLLGSNFSTVKFTYYDKSGAETSTLANIVSVRVNLTSQYVLSNAFVLTKGKTQDTLYVTSDSQVHPAVL